MSNIMVTFNELRLENQRWIIEKDDIEAIDKEADNFFRTGNDYPLEVFTVFIAISDDEYSGLKSITCPANGNQHSVLKEITIPGVGNHSINSYNGDMHQKM